jgi:PAS domain S-box-containing protein
VLAAAQALHGASFSEAVVDGADLVVALHAAGFALLAAGLLGSAPSAGAVSIEIREPLLFLPAGIAALAGVLALARSRLPGFKGLRRLAPALLLLGGADALTALEPRANFGLGSVGLMAYAAHGVKLLGFLSLGAWLWGCARSSIRTRFVVAFAALLLVVILVLSTSLTAVISDNVGDAQLASVQSQLETQRTGLEDEALELLEQTDQIAALDGVQEQLAAQRRPGDLVRSINKSGDFFVTDFVAVLNERGIQLAFTNEGPAMRGARGGVVRTTLHDRDMLLLLGSKVVTGLIDRAEGAASIDVLPGRSIPLILAGAPVPRPEGGGLAGFLITGRYLDTLRMREIASNLDPVEASIVAGSRLVATTVPGGVSGRALVPRDLRGQLMVGGSVGRQHSIGSRSYFSAIGPLRDSLKTHTGASLVLSTPSSVVVETRGDVIRLLFLIALVVGAVVLALAWLSGRRITRPIQQLTVAAQRVREGEFAATAPVSGRDEVGQLGETFNDMTAALLRMTNELRTAAREEHDLRERIETIIQSMADGLVAVDADGRVLAFNAEAEVMTGQDAADVVGRPVDEVLVAIDAQRHPVRLPIHDLREGSIGNVFLRRPRREPVPVTITSALLRDEQGKPTGSVAIVRDMTREREVERMKSEFLSNISHELRTPLTPIKGYAEILSHKEVPQEKSRQFATGILDSTTRLERIVSLLVDFAAMEAGRLAPNARPVDLAGLLERVRFEWAGRDAKHRFEVDVADELPDVLGDERLLRRSIEEIVDNAVKFSPHGGTIKMKATTLDDGPGRARRTVQVVVTDEGIGIAPEDLPRVFSDFQQLDGSQTRAFGGLGLGLAFVRRIIEAHQGTIDVQSELDHGTRLTVVIPAARDAPKDD